MFYYIDFSCWRVEAKSEDEAIKRAQEFLKKGSPCICFVEQIPNDNEGEQSEFIESEFEPRGDIQ
jgi:hypothetical protein